MTTVHRFDGHTAMQFAKHKARYGHRYWLVWHMPDGSQAASRATATTLEQAIGEAAPYYDKGPAIWFVAGDGLAEFYGRSVSIVLKNMKAGHWSG